MIGKKHILLIENSENEIEFFRDALEESGLDFLLNTARSIQEAFTIPDRNTADMIFVDVQLAMKHNIVLARRLKSFYPGPVVFYSNIQTGQTQKGLHENFNYVQLPGSTKSMGRILRNLFAGNEVILSEELAESRYTY
jgi:DNA-binding NtrC family response regulator